MTQKAKTYAPEKDGDNLDMVVELLSQIVPAFFKDCVYLIDTDQEKISAYAGYGRKQLYNCVNNHHTKLPNLIRTIIGLGISLKDIARLLGPIVEEILRRENIPQLEIDYSLLELENLYSVQELLRKYKNDSL